MTEERRLVSLTRYAMVGDLNDRHMEAVPDGEYLLRSDVLAALPQPATEPTCTCGSASSYMGHEHLRDCPIYALMRPKPATEPALTRFTFVADTFDSLARMEVAADGEWVRYDAARLAAQPSAEVERLDWLAIVELARAYRPEGPPDGEERVRLGMLCKRIIDAALAGSGLGDDHAA